VRHSRLKSRPILSLALFALLILAVLGYGVGGSQPTAVASEASTVVQAPLAAGATRAAETVLPTPRPTTAASRRAAPLASRFVARPGDRVTWVRPGVVHIQRTTTDPLRINLLLFDLVDPAFELKVRVGWGWLSGRHRTTTMANEMDALAAVNGDLFSTDNGAPQGLMMTGGQVLTAPKYRATFAWSRDSGPFIGYFTREWTWLAEVESADGARSPVTLLNMRCPRDQICLFNSFARTVPAREGEVRVLLNQRGLVEQIVRGEALTIKPGKQVLVGSGLGARWLLAQADLGDKLIVRTTTDPPLARFDEAISGGPIILSGGAFVQDCLCALHDCSQTREPEAKLICEDFSTDWKLRHYLGVRMPRTGVGFDRSATTLIVAVVDGYQRGYSRGVTQREFADLFLEFGADTAMELDGGGSSTMVLEGSLVNRPPDQTGERYVANALLLFWRDISE